jgi:hypothetical protein
LTVQLLIQKRTEGILFDNDAKDCYDRIISIVALAALHRLGYSKESVKMLGLLWAHMEHHVCSGFIVSDKTYGSTINKLMYDIGQGSCASPILWDLINQLVLAAFGEKFTYISMVVIDGVADHIRPGNLFVDDTMNRTTNDDPELEPISTDQVELTTSEETLIAKMEEIIQFFLDLLQVTGKDLAPEKCVWYPISHIQKDGKPILLQKHSSHRGIKIISRSTITESGVKRKEPDEGHHTLGFFHDWRRHMLCSQESDDRESISQYRFHPVQLPVERGLHTCIQLLILSLARVSNSCNNNDSAGMLRHPKAGSQCHPAENGDP